MHFRPWKNSSNIPVCTCRRMCSHDPEISPGCFFRFNNGGYVAKERGEDLFIGCILTAGAMLFALASPFINAVDLLGSLLAKSTDDNQQEHRSECARLITSK